jgi:1-acyl-sn-glycerol-3-phosphate acyltransferase
MFAAAVEHSSRKKLSKWRLIANNNAMTSPGYITGIATAKSMRLIAHAVAAGRLQTVSSGTEHIPATGPALIVARHYHHLFDGLSLFAAVPRQFHILVTLDWVQNAGTRFFMTQMARLARWPVVLRREALIRLNEIGASRYRALFSLVDVTRYERKALRESVQLLVEQRVLVVFPEGYPNIDPMYTPKRGDEDFLPFKPGFVAIARNAENRLGAPLPIIPTGLRYTLGKRSIAHVSFGRPVYRKNFASGAELISYCERSVKEMSV